MYGSKAGNLIKLSSNGVTVPKTWVIRNSYPLSILKRNNIDLYDINTVHNFFAEHFDAYNELYEAVEKFTKENKEIKRFAIRSSQEYEDGNEMSFSGLFYTALNIGNTANIVNSIIKCWKESFNKGIMEYSRKNKHFKPVPCSIIIQQFIMSDRAGVAFKSKNKIIIDSNYGLAKSIVDGDTGVDEWVVNAENNKVINYSSNKEKINIPITSRVNPNPEEIVEYGEYKNLKVKKFNNADSIIEVELPPEFKDAPSLNYSEIENLIKKCDTVSQILKINDYDIEWAFDKEKIYILQCRPLTRAVEIDIRSNNKLDSNYGIGLVKGEATAKAIKVYDDNTAIKFEKGGILVTKRLSGNILLAASKAIGCIIESKSPLSHSAIIARELGIPVIGNVDLKKIHNGEIYYMNGLTGEYKVVNNNIKTIEKDKMEFKEDKIKNKKTREYIKDMLYTFEQNII